MPCNIRRRARRLRMVAGVLSLIAAGMLAFALWEQGADRWWRVLVLPPLQFGLMGILQSRQGVCAAYALLGIWECPTGTAQKIPDPHIENQFKERAKRLLLVSLALSCSLLAAFLLL